MDRDSTVLIVAHADAGWAALTEHLSERYGYRVLTAETGADGLKLAHDVHIDLAVAEEGNKEFDGCGFLEGMRISHPDVIRVLVLAKGSAHAGKVITQASVFQYLRKPLDIDQAALVVKRGLDPANLPAATG